MRDATQPLDEQPCLPTEPIDTVVDPLKRFLHIESASGVILLGATVVALALANSPLAEQFLGIWKTRFVLGLGAFRMDYSLQHWINDGLMAVFFFVVGLEVKRELVMGELRDLRQAVLPIAGALGGMLVPAAIYLFFQYGSAGERGWGIPMATDIAFVVGCLAILGPRIPTSMRVMLLSLAIADDIGAILVIAIGYTDALNLLALGLAAVGIGLIFALIKFGCRNIAVYLLLMFFVWLAFHESGIHATIAGVIFGLIMPTRAWISETLLSKIVDKTRTFLDGAAWTDSHSRYAMLREMEIATRKSITPLERFETELHPWVGFAIMPVFALANAGVTVDAADFINPVAIAVMCGLVLGKPLGITLFCWLAVKIGLCRLPPGVGWTTILGGSFLAGIGFTMALFISSLALDGELLDAAKVGVLSGSLLSAVAGMAILLVFLPKKAEEKVVCP